MSSRIISKLCTLFLLFTLFCYLTNPALAQETTYTTSNGHETKSFPAQCSIYYPFATHGKQSTDYLYHFSLNLLYGKIGELNGVEVSGLVGIAQGDVHGMQIAGIGNGAGNVKGIQTGGLFTAADDVKGLQVGGLFNAAAKVQGIQLGGLFTAADDVKGLQVGGLFNAAAKVQGIQLGGLFTAADDVKGLQVGGLFNAAAKVQGVQTGGLFNAADEVNGLQISGIFNRSHTLRGVQIGLVSVNDTIEKGFSMSLVNIVKRGVYREWEASFSEYVNISVSYKMGTKKFYSIYSVGANFIEDNLWAYGVGFGNRTALGNRIDFRPELVSYSYLPMDFKNVRFTFSTHLKFGFVYNINEKLGLSLAPSVYTMNSNRKSDAEHYHVSPMGAFYTREKGKDRTTMGVGLSLGISLQ